MHTAWDYVGTACNEEHEVSQIEQVLLLCQKALKP